MDTNKKAGTNSGMRDNAAITAGAPDKDKSVPKSMSADLDTENNENDFSVDAEETENDLSGDVDQTELNDESELNDDAELYGTEDDTVSSYDSDGAGQGNTQLEKFFQAALQDIYWAENHLTKALPKMHKAATTEQLKGAISEHLEQTMVHVSRLEQVFELMGQKAQAKKCDAMEGIVKEGESIVQETEDGSMTRDVGIIMAAQKVEHYEIATYGGLIQLAETLGMEEVSEILELTLAEEKQTDLNLSDIAKNNINWEAEQEGA